MLERLAAIFGILGVVLAYEEHFLKPEQPINVTVINPPPPPPPPPIHPPPPPPVTKWWFKVEWDDLTYDWRGPYDTYNEAEQAKEPYDDDTSGAVVGTTNPEEIVGEPPPPNDD